jgi:hypothetical protein
MHIRMTGGRFGPSQENRHENTSHCCRFWSRCGVARFCPVSQRTPLPAKVQLVECSPAMGAQQPQQFRRSKLRRISAVGELISGCDSKAFQMVGDQVANLGPTTMRLKVSGRPGGCRAHRIDPPVRGFVRYKGPRQGTDPLSYQLLWPVDDRVAASGRPPRGEGGQAALCRRLGSRAWPRSGAGARSACQPSVPQLQPSENCFSKRRA